MSEDDPEPWAVEEETALVEAPPYLRVYRQRVRLPDGGTLDPFFRLALPDFVVVVPWTPEGRAVLVREYRHGARGVCLAPPGGMIDPGETPLEAARRELLEETGYTAGRWHALGSHVVLGNYHGCVGHFFEAEAASWTQPPSLDGSEDLRVVLLDADDARAAARDGRVAVAHHALALLLARLHP